MRFTKEEIKELKSCVITVIEEGFSVPPYQDIFYDVIKKLGIKQEEVGQPYNISRPDPAEPTETKKNG